MYFSSLRVLGDLNVIGVCSNDRARIKEYYGESGNESWDIRTIHLNFDTEDLDKLYCLEADHYHMDVFTDTGMYYKSHSEAKAKADSLNEGERELFTVREIGIL